MNVRPSRVVTLTTDAGASDPLVGVVKGAILKAAPKTVTVDLAHEVSARDVAAGAFLMWSAIGRWPDGAVHVGLVDAGSGCDRRILAASAHQQYWLAPDNGLLGAVLAAGGDAQVRAVDASHLGLQRDEAVFDSRVALAAAAALLSSGRYGFGALGPAVSDYDGRDMVFCGAPRVVHADRHGNLVINARVPRGVEGSIQVNGRTLPLHRRYSDVDAGCLYAYVGALGLLEITARDGSAAAALGIARGDEISLATS